MSEERNGIRNIGLGLTFLVIFLWVFFILSPVILRDIRYWLAPDDWMKAELTFGERYDESGWPYIIFTRTINREFSVEWYGWVDEVVDTAPEVVSRVCGGPGVHAYSPVDTGTVRMTAEYFLGVKCDLPKVPFRVCKRWILEDNYGLTDTAGPACTEVFDPRETENGE